MKVFAVNCSPRANGNCAFLLNTVLREIAGDGIETELFQLGGHTVSGCRACMVCRQKQNQRCVITTDPINDCIGKMIEADAILIASPTYFADVTTEAKALIDRAGYVAMANGRLFKRKIGGAISVHRRGGAVNTFDSINHFFLINGMIVPGSTYWNFGVGRNIGETETDLEAIANMQDLGQTIRWLLPKLR
ncbi:MAG: flavodoxin family protein [Victivallaceae bacterium]